MLQVKSGTKMHSVKPAMRTLPLLPAGFGAAITRGSSAEQRIRVFPMFSSLERSWQVRLVRTQPKFAEVLSFEQRNAFEFFNDMPNRHDTTSAAKRMVCLCGQTRINRCIL